MTSKIANPMNAYHFHFNRIPFFILVVLAFATNSFAGGKETIIYNFGKGVPYGPGAALLADSAGNLYGTSFYSSPYGYVFKLSPPAVLGGAWTLTTICEVTAYIGTPIMNKAGNLFVETSSTVEELSPPLKPGGQWRDTQIWNAFASAREGLTGRLYLVDGHLYGTSTQGGSSTACEFGCGIVFELTRRSNGTWTETDVYDFGSFAGDGERPWADMVFRNGAIYGITLQGGATGNGTFFQLVPSNGAWTENILYNFTSAESVPRALLADPAGNFFGAAYNNPNAGDGTIFELSPPSDAGGQWQESTLYTFTGKSDGAAPNAPLWRDKLGDLYGTTSSGAGCFGRKVPCGSAFKLKAPSATGGSWTFVLLHDFGVPGDGTYPGAGLTFYNGVFYGITEGGGSFGGGTVFSIVP